VSLCAKEGMLGTTWRLIIDRISASRQSGSRTVALDAEGRAVRTQRDGNAGREPEDRVPMPSRRQPVYIAGRMGHA
jgi:hypothetical protein